MAYSSSGCTREYIPSSNWMDLEVSLYWMLSASVLISWTKLIRCISLVTLLITQVRWTDLWFRHLFPYSHPYRFMYYTAPWWGWIPPSPCRLEPALVTWWRMKFVTLWFIQEAWVDYDDITEYIMRLKIVATMAFPVSFGTTYRERSRRHRKIVSWIFSFFSYQCLCRV